FSGHSAEHAAAAATVESAPEAEPAPSYQQEEPAPSYQQEEPAASYQQDEPAPTYQQDEPAPTYQQDERQPQAAAAEPVAPSQDEQSGDVPQESADQHAPADTYQAQTSEPDSYEAAAADAEPEPSRPFENWSAPQQSAMVMTGDRADDTHEHYFNDQAAQPSQGDEPDDDRLPEPEPATTPSAQSGVWSPYSPQQQPASSS
ncbi:MAG: hypothetical protein ABI468_07975, partial [Candidatus Nanopelagicales bacterium]